MRSWLAIMYLAGCTTLVDPSSTTNPPPPPVGEGGGGLPTRVCGNTGGGASVGCAVWNGLCFGSWGASASLTGAGDCVAAPAPGVVTATVATDALVSDAAAALVAGEVQISARAGDRVLALAAPPTPGTYACASAVVAIGYFQLAGDALPALDYRSWVPDQAPSCTVTLQHVGDIGDTIDGSFSATLFAWTGTGTLDVAGTFSVERIAY